MKNSMHLLILFCLFTVIAAMSPIMVQAQLFGGRFCGPRIEPCYRILPPPRSVHRSCCKPSYYHCSPMPCGCWAQTVYGHCSNPCHRGHFGVRLEHAYPYAYCPWSVQQEWYPWQHHSQMAGLTEQPSCNETNCVVEYNDAAQLFEIKKLCGFTYCYCPIPNLGNSRSFGEEKCKSPQFPKPRLFGIKLNGGLLYFEFPSSSDPRTNHDFGWYRLHGSTGNHEWKFSIEYKSVATTIATVVTGGSIGSVTSNSEIEYYDSGSRATLKMIHYHVPGGDEATYTFEHYVVKVIRLY